MLKLPALEFSLPEAIAPDVAVAHGRLLSIGPLFRLVTTSLSVPWLFVYTIQQLCRLLEVLVESTVAVTLSHILPMFFVPFVGGFRMGWLDLFSSAACVPRVEISLYECVLVGGRRSLQLILVASHNFMFSARN